MKNGFIIVQAALIFFFLSAKSQELQQTYSFKDLKFLNSISFDINDTCHRSLKTRYKSKKHVQQIITSDTIFQVKLSDIRENSFICIVNKGDNIIVNPRLTINNKGNWYSITDMLSEIINQEMSERDKALAIWLFIVKNRYNDFPAHPDIELHDPVRLFNVYGYGFCDDAATNLMLLARAADMDARIWELNGHVVPEVFFEGDWRILDADAEVYYLENDGYSIAGMKALKNKPDLINKYPSPIYINDSRIAEMYLSNKDNKTSEWYSENSETTHKMSFLLRPGESITRFFEKKEAYYYNQFDKEPKIYSNGIFAFAPVFKDNLFKKGAEKVHNIHTKGTGKNTVLVSENDGGEIVYSFKSPYPFLDGEISIIAKGQIELAFSQTGKEWTILKCHKKGKAYIYSLKPHLSIGKESPVYTYYIKIFLKGKINQLLFESLFQCAPKSLPVLNNGSNKIHYWDDTEENMNAQIIFEYKKNHSFRIFKKRRHINLL